jgi:hypothetical protein
VWYVGVPSEDADGYTVARAAIEARRDFHCVIPLTLDPSVVAAEGANVNNIADPNTTLRDGVVQKFRVVLGSGELPTATTVSDGTINGVAQQPGTSSGRYRTVSIATGSAVDVQSVLPGDTITFGLPSTGAPSGWQNRRGTHLVSHVNNNYTDTNPAYPSNDSVFEIEPGTSRWDDTAATGPGDIEVVIRAPDGTVKVSKLGSRTVSVNSGNVVWAMRNPTTVGGPYTITYVAGTSASVSVVGFSITLTYVTGGIQLGGTAAVGFLFTDTMTGGPVAYGGFRAVRLTATRLVSRPSTISTRTHLYPPKLTGQPNKYLVAIRPPDKVLQ